MDINKTSFLLEVYKEYELLVNPSDEALMAEGNKYLRDGCKLCGGNQVVAIVGDSYGVATVWEYRLAMIRKDLEKERG